MKLILGVTTVVYLVVMYVLAMVASRRIHNTTDYLVAGRRLPLSLAWMTILATWFGAGTLLTAADEVRAQGLQAAALDPFGAGCCLLFAGWFVAGPMWRQQLLTVPDFFAAKYGRHAELVSSLILVPSYFGWVAAQFMALAGILELFFQIDPMVGLPLVAAIGMGYTLLGGMWSVTLTDAVQICLVLLGLIVLTISVLYRLGDGAPQDGWLRLVRETPESHRVLIPSDSMAAFVGWLGVFLTGVLGNLPGQDLMQRIFAARSEQVARRACLVAGVAYLGFGLLPLVLAVASVLLIPENTESAILPALAEAFLNPVLAVVFLVALLSAILSTIDSAILSPAGILAQNVFPRFTSMDSLRLNRWAVLFVTGCSLATAFAGENAWTLLEESYVMPLAGLFVPLMLGLYSHPRHPTAGMVAMICGAGIWLIHFLTGMEFFCEFLPAMRELQIPVALAAPVMSLLSYWLIEPPWQTRWSGGNAQ